MTLVPPLSKSDAQRALVLADVLGVAFEDVLPAGEPLPRDVEVLRAGLLALREPSARIDCHDGGAPFRFLLAQAALQPGRVVDFTGTPRLGERPHAPLLAALRAVPGVRITEGTPWPLRVESPAVLRGPVELMVSGEESSQFASSLLLGAARLAQAGVQVALRVSGALASEGYYALTRSWLTRCGFALEDAAGLTTVRRSAGAGASRDSAQDEGPPLTPSGGERVAFPPVPGDWSSLGYLLALSWVSGVPVARLAFDTGHPDEEIARQLRGVGLSVHERVTGTPTGGFHPDAAICPDAIPTLAVWATRLSAPSTFAHVGILRHKESDRLEGVRALLTAAGLSSSLEGDTLTVPPGAAKAFHFDARDDHRLAMSAAVLARLHGVTATLRGKDSVGKSFPGFWAEAAKAGVHVEAWT